MQSEIFRNSKLFLRNEFETSGEWEFPIIHKQIIDLDNVNLISYSDTSLHDACNLHKGVHFFVDDYRFVSIYNNPEKSLEKLRKYRFVLSPDFSLYSEMNIWRQIESTGMARWTGAYWQSNGLVVIPTVSWGLSPSFQFCFQSIEKSSIVAVGMIGCKHNHLAFMRGYNAMLEAIEPSAIICFGSPFPEMEGNIIPIDYIASRKVVRNGR